MNSKTSMTPETIAPYYVVHVGISFVTKYPIYGGKRYSCDYRQAFAFETKEEAEKVAQTETGFNVRVCKVETVITDI